MSRKGLAFAGGVLLAVAATPAFAAPQNPVKPPSLTPQPQAPAPAAPTQETARRISVAEARQALAKGEAVLVDVRPKESYDASHAQGAISLPLSDLGSRAGELPKDKLVITYCT
ncbi:MAG TPA: rhodanese-like domain-containing protein [Thermoanaerobaculia bacterium]|nr:rhodanese-like domain-containing protein [Thermoanaerobaculia bacterium]